MDDGTPSVSAYPLKSFQTDEARVAKKLFSLKQKTSLMSFFCFLGMLALVEA